MTKVPWPAVARPLRRLWPAPTASISGGAEDGGLWLAPAPSTGDRPRARMAGSSSTGDRPRAQPGPARAQPAAVPLPAPSGGGVKNKEERRRRDEQSRRKMSTGERDAFVRCLGKQKKKEKKC